ncbi:unnamed protein product [Gadus morhua 'NCC']
MQATIRLPSKGTRGDTASVLDDDHLHSGSTSTLSQERETSRSDSSTQRLRTTGSVDTWTSTTRFSFGRACPPLHKPASRRPGQYFVGCMEGIVYNGDPASQRSIAGQKVDTPGLIDPTRGHL